MVPYFIILLLDIRIIINGMYYTIYHKKKIGSVVKDKNTRKCKHKTINKSKLCILNSVFESFKVHHYTKTYTI